MKPARPLRIPLVLTCTVLTGAGLVVSASCSSSSSPVGHADAAPDSRLADSAGPDSATVDSMGPVDSAPADSNPVDVVLADSTIGDVVTDSSAADSTICGDSGCVPPDAAGALACLVLVDGSPVDLDGSNEIIYVTDGGNCPPGDEPLV
jgi:hypothetical protein